MKCPTCTDIALVMTDRQGVEIDYCPQCRGVWLDRGELEKLIAVEEAPGRQSTPPPGYQRPTESAFRPEHQDRYDREDDGYRKKKRRDLFDIFD